MSGHHNDHVYTLIVKIVLSLFNEGALHANREYMKEPPSSAHWRWCILDNTARRYKVLGRAPQQLKTCYRMYFRSRTLISCDRNVYFKPKCKTKENFLVYKCLLHHFIRLKISEDSMMILKIDKGLTGELFQCNIFENLQLWAFGPYMFVLIILVRFLRVDNNIAQFQEK